MLRWFQKALHRCRPVQLNLLLQPQLCTKGRMKTTDPHSSPAISHPNVPVVKLIIIGDSNVGKSCLLQRFCDDEFSPSFIATIGIDHRSKTISLGSGDNLKLQIWDTAGQEQYKAMTSSFYRSAMGVAVVYDVTWRRSFMNIPNWIRNLEEHASDKIVKFLVGNKCDVEENRAVGYQEGKEMAQRFGMTFLETSAKSSQNVDELFHGLAKECMKNLAVRSNGNVGSSTVNLFTNPSQKLNSGFGSCCK